MKRPHRKNPLNPKISRNEREEQAQARKVNYMAGSGVDKALNILGSAVRTRRLPCGGAIHLMQNVEGKWQPVSSIDLMRAAGVTREAN